MSFRSKSMHVDLNGIG